MKKVFELIKGKIYQKGNTKRIDFFGTRADYKVSMIFYSITSSGNIKVGDIVGERGGMPSNVRNRIAQLRYRNNMPYWWIEDGTGSLILTL